MKSVRQQPRGDGPESSRAGSRAFTVIRVIRVIRLLGLLVVFGSRV